MLEAMVSTDRESDLSLTVLSSMLAWSHKRSCICSLSGWVCRSATTLTETVSICSVSLTQNISQQVPWAFKNSLILFHSFFFVHNYYLWTAFNHISSNVICMTHICFSLTSVWECKWNPLVSCRGHFGSWKSSLECCREQRSWSLLWYVQTNQC